MNVLERLWPLALKGIGAGQGPVLVDVLVAVGATLALGHVEVLHVIVVAIVVVRVFLPPLRHGGCASELALALHAALLVG